MPADLAQILPDLTRRCLAHVDAETLLSYDIFHTPAGWTLGIHGPRIDLSHLPPAGSFIGRLFADSLIHSIASNCHAAEPSGPGVFPGSAQSVAAALAASEWRAQEAELHPPSAEELDQAWEEIDAERADVRAGRDWVNDDYDGVDDDDGQE